MKNKHKSKIKFTFFKKHKKLAVILVCLVFFLSSFAFINYSRYVKNVIQTYYLRTKKFYFNSNRLTLDNRVYKSNPWVIDDPRDYEISISLNTKLNNLRVMDTDVEYNTTCSVTTKEGTPISAVKCYIKGEPNEKSTMNRKICGNHPITSSDRCNNDEPNLDSFNIVVKVLDAQELRDGDSVFINVEASSTAPYRQTLEARFELIVGNYGVTYEIDDEMNRRYIDCIVTNTMPDDKPVVELEISDEYTDKIIFDQNNAILDVINSYSDIDKAKYGFGVTIENGYVKKVRFRVDEKSSALVRFYKKVLSDDYSFNTNSFNAGTSSEIVTMTVYDKEELERQYEESLRPPAPPEPEEPEEPGEGEGEEENEEENNGEGTE